MCIINWCNTTSDGSSDLTFYSKNTESGEVNLNLSTTTVTNSITLPINSKCILVASGGIGISGSSGGAVGINYYIELASITGSPTLLYSSPPTASGSGAYKTNVYSISTGSSAVTITTTWTLGRYYKLGYLTELAVFTK